MLKPQTDRKRLWWLGSTAVLLLLVGFIWRVPQWGLSRSITDEKVKAELLNANRDNALKVIQTIGGLGFIGTAYLAWRNLQLAEDKNVTDRFSKAVEMLADDKLEVRLGGIYSLERIARDSKADHAVVMEVLTAFVRAKSTPREEELTLSQDIQSTLTVIGRRTPIENEQPIDLRGALLSYADLNGAFLSWVNLSWANLSGAKLFNTNLTSANLVGANLINANFSFANLSSASLSWTKLNGASLSGANLSEAKLSGAKLNGANLVGANFSDADLSRANLIDADVRGANLTDVDLSEADLSNADLSGANLSGADLSNADLEGVSFDEKTIWPDKTEVAKATNIPTTVKTRLGIEVTPPAGPEHP
ncbi:pentapeptide repeat-containing protein [Nodosilinea sp. FACHB-131]|uniref:pentapeptide repeat-containing protein n=1 Tax=Cyanophyceae TaxID=3028117 RepID=UPI001686A89A|nr:pentapeptide repeat-containing protein [Nodosilinea sp. FACHB-131]MBD1875060.1 pentapeptide repeat-containing protein [Nodosilinea sp. FACHB-131]